MNSLYSYFFKGEESKTQQIEVIEDPVAKYIPEELQE
jgi:hypothetical protein